MVRRDEAILLAQAEVEKQTWATTRQFLALNKVALDDDGSPVVARVDDTSEAGAYFAYFPIQDERYHFVVVIRSDEDGELEVSGIYMEAGSSVYLGIFSSSIHPDDITARLGITPTDTSVMGDLILKGLSTRRHSRHIWHYEPQASLPGSVEEKLRTLLESLEAVAPRISSLRLACEIQATIVLHAWYGNSMLGGFHLDADIVQRLASLGAEVECDLYVSGPPITDDQDAEESSE